LTIGLADYLNLKGLPELVFLLTYVGGQKNKKNSIDVCYIGWWTKV
jgi:hypothetical protein